SSTFFNNTICDRVSLFFFGGRYAYKLLFHWNGHMFLDSYWHRLFHGHRYDFLHRIWDLLLNWNCNGFHNRHRNMLDDRHMNRIRLSNSYRYRMRHGTLPIFFITGTGTGFVTSTCSLIGTA
ncbi:hypothetical protein ALC60_09268, partial [Trachymyrmex zeteki]